MTVRISEKKSLPHEETIRRPLRALAALALWVCAWAAQAESIQVLHWWKSDSERRAVGVLAAKLSDDNIAWRDGGIAGGAGGPGGPADIVLKSRVLAGDAPDVAQLNGVLLGEWAALGLLREFDAVAANGKWDKLLLPTVWTLVRPHGRVVAAPLGIHRINTLFYNRKLFNQYGIAPPQTWDDFERAAALLHQAGIVPLAQSSEPWQVATLFETLVLAEAGPAFYRELFVKKNAQAFTDTRFAHVLKRLRTMKKWMAAPLQERAWNEVARQFADGGAAMMVMGDWMKGELNTWGLATDDAFGCTAAPGTTGYHLYDVDTLAMLDTGAAHRPAQEKLAQLAVSPAVQADYNQLKGSIPVLRNPDLSKMDSCARASWQLFARGSTVQVPSLVHRMAADEVTKNAVIAEVHRYFINDRVSVADAQQRLAAVAQMQIMKAGK